MTASRVSFACWGDSPATFTPFGPAGTGSPLESILKVSIMPHAASGRGFLPPSIWMALTRKDMSAMTLWRKLAAALDVARRKAFARVHLATGLVPQGPATRAPAAGEAATSAAGEIRGEAAPVQARAQHIGWARLLERVFEIDMRRCPSCGADELEIIAAILQRAAIEKILTHLGLDPRPPGSMPFRVGRDALPDGRRGAERVIGKVLQA